VRRNIFFFLIIFLSVAGNSQNLDIRMLRSIYSPEQLKSDGFFRLTSNSEAYVAAGIPVGLAVAGLISNDRDMLRNAIVMAAGEALNEGLKFGLKYSINRDRPFETYPDIVRKIAAGGPSFPSGHTSSAFETATSVSLAYPKWYVIVPSYGWAGTVAYSRMHLGVHYPSDVLAGAVIGAGSAYLTYKINQKLNYNRRPKPCNCPK
jgi:membrane-associated phospholipid phosphatase